MDTDPNIVALQESKERDRRDDASAVNEGRLTGRELAQQNDHFAPLAAEAVLVLAHAEALG